MVRLDSEDLQFSRGGEGNRSKPPLLKRRLLRGLRVGEAEKVALFAPELLGAELGVFPRERQSGAAGRAEERSVESTRGVRLRWATRRSRRRGLGPWRAAAPRRVCRGDVGSAGLELGRGAQP